MNYFEFDNHGAELSNREAKNCKWVLEFQFICFGFDCMEKLESLCLPYGSKNNSNIAHFPVPPSVTFPFSFKWLTELSKPFMIGEGDCISWVFYTPLKIALLVICSVKMDDISWLLTMSTSSELYIRNSHNRFTFDGFWLDTNPWIKFCLALTSLLCFNRHLTKIRLCDLFIRFQNKMKRLWNLS